MVPPQRSDIQWSKRGWWKLVFSCGSDLEHEPLVGPFSEAKQPLMWPNEDGMALLALHIRVKR